LAERRLQIFLCLYTLCVVALNDPSSHFFDQRLSFIRGQQADQRTIGPVQLPVAEAQDRRI
jgi:hypothetical protein